MIDIPKRIAELCRVRGWTYYRLALETGLNANTIYRWKSNGAIPSIFAVEQICEVMNISLAQFFRDEEHDDIETEEKLLYNAWNALANPEKKLVTELIDILNRK